MSKFAYPCKRFNVKILKRKNYGLSMIKPARIFRSDEKHLQYIVVFFMQKSQASLKHRLIN